MNVTNFNKVENLIAEKTQLPNALEKWLECDLDMIRDCIKKNVTKGEDFEFNFCYGVHPQFMFGNEYTYDNTYECFIIAYQLIGDNPNEVRTDMITMCGMYGLGDGYYCENITYNGNDLRFLSKLQKAILRGVEDFKVIIHRSIEYLFY